MNGDDEIVVIKLDLKSKYSNLIENPIDTISYIQEREKYQMHLLARKMKL